MTGATVVTLPLELRDAEGRLVGEIGLDDQGPCLRFFNTAGAPTVRLGTTYDGGELALTDRDGTLKAELGTCYGDAGMLSLFRDDERYTEIIPSN
jgi:hypothetical protein